MIRLLTVPCTLLTATLLIATPTMAAQRPGTASGVPDLSGTYDIATITPLQRPEQFVSFTVEDPNTWTAPWSGEYPWPATQDRLYEYACHEGNYAMEGMLRGARILEAEALADRPADGPADRPADGPASGGGGN
ncbi:MAG: hypothetical protein AB7I04_19645 [Pseudomonadales bacterium]